MGSRGTYAFVNVTTVTVTVTKTSVTSPVISSVWQDVAHPGVDLLRVIPRPASVRTPTPFGIREFQANFPALNHVSCVHLPSDVGLWLRGCPRSIPTPNYVSVRCPQLADGGEHQSQGAVRTCARSPAPGVLGRDQALLPQGLACCPSHPAPQRHWTEDIAPTVRSATSTFLV